MMKFIPVLALFAVACNSGAPANELPRSINVSGDAELKAMPDVSNISLYITAQGNNKSSVVNELSATVSKIREQLKSVKTTSITIDNLNIDWQYTYSKLRPRTIRYDASQSIVIKTALDPDEIEKIVQIATAVQKADFYIRFELSEKRMDSLKNAATAAAIKNADSKAKSIAGAAGLELKEILNISYHAANQAPYLYGNQSYKMARDDEFDANLSPDEISVSDNVKVTYRIK